MYSFIMILFLQTKVGIELEIYRYYSEESNYVLAYDMCMDEVESHIFDTSDSEEASVIAGVCLKNGDVR